MVTDEMRAQSALNHFDSETHGLQLEAHFTQKQLAVALAKVAELEGAAAARDQAEPAGELAPKDLAALRRGVAASLKDGETFSTELLPLEETEPAPAKVPSE